MKLSKSRLGVADQIVFVKVVLKSITDMSFKDLRENREDGYRSVVGECIVITSFV